jgi:hypothetical protein
VGDGIQKIGVVIRDHGTLGKLAIIGAGRSNDVPNLEDGKFWLGNGTNVATPVAMSSDGTMDNLGALTLADAIARDSELHAEAHTVASHSDTSAAGSDLDTLTDDADGNSLHYHGTVTKTTAASYTIGTTNVNEKYGGVIYVTGAATITIPAVATTMSFTVITIGATAVSVDPDDADKMYLDGVLLDDGDKATNTSTTGDTLVCSYFSADGWYCMGGSPDGDAWTDGS